MGKRTINKVQVYYCDWTGLPFSTATSPAYIPTFENDKVRKVGTYCNWESAMAAVYATDADTAINALEPSVAPRCYTRVAEYVHKKCGAAIKPAPHFSNLQHFGGSMSANEFFEACAASGVADGVHVKEDGSFGSYSTDFASLQADNTLVVTKTKASKIRTFKVFHGGNRVNSMATAYLGVQVYGDVYVAEERNGRFIDLSYANFHTLFCSRGVKRTLDAASEQLQAFEVHTSKDTEKPNDLAQAAKYIAKAGTGKLLKDIAHHAPPLAKQNAFAVGVA